MTVKDLRKELEQYDDTAEVVIVNWCTGSEYEPTVGGDDPDEFIEYCRIGWV